MFYYVVLQHVKLMNFAVTTDTALVAETAFATTLTAVEITVTKEAARIHQVSFMHFHFEHGVLKEYTI